MPFLPFTHANPTRDPTDTRPPRLLNTTSIADIITDKTIASVMRAVYFNEGPFSDAVDRVRNNSQLWPYGKPRQAGNPDEGKRVWEGMVERCREKRMHQDAGRMLGSGDGRGTRLDAAKEVVQPQTQTQPTWTEVQQVEKPAEEANEVKSMLAKVQEAKLVVLEKRRTALDFFEWEAPRPNSE